MAIVSAAVDLISGNQASQAAKGAANIASDAQRDSNALALQIYNQQRSDLTPQRIIGNEALFRLADLNNVRRPIANDAIPSNDFKVTTGRYGGASLPVLGGQPTAFAGQPGVTMAGLAQQQGAAPATQQGQPGANFVPLGYNQGSYIGASDLGFNFNAQQPRDPRANPAAAEEWNRQQGFRTFLDRASQLSGAEREAYIAENLRQADVNNLYSPGQRSAVEAVLRSGLNSQQFAANNFRYQVAGNAPQASNNNTQAAPTLPVQQAGASAVSRPQQQSSNAAQSSQQVNPYTGFMESPDYQFRLNEGNKAIERAAAARGLRNSGAEYKSLANYNQNAASQEYGANYNRLAALAGIGQTATAQSNAAAGAYADSAGQGLQNIGAIQAQGKLQSKGAQTQSYLNAYSSLKDPFGGFNFSQLAGFV